MQTQHFKQLLHMRAAVAGLTCDPASTAAAPPLARVRGLPTTPFGATTTRPKKKTPVVRCHRHRKCSAKL